MQTPFQFFNQLFQKEQATQRVAIKKLRRLLLRALGLMALLVWLLLAANQVFPQLLG